MPLAWLAGNLSRNAAEIIEQAACLGLELLSPAREAAARTTKSA